MKVKIAIRNKETNGLFEGEIEVPKEPPYGPHGPFKMTNVLDEHNEFVWKQQAGIRAISEGKGHLRILIGLPRKFIAFEINNLKLQEKRIVWTGRNVSNSWKFISTPFIVDITLLEE